MNELRVILKDMPARINGFTVKGFDSGEDFYTVFINACLSYEQQRKAYAHELDHIVNEDYDSGCSADTIEYIRHGGI